MDFMFDPYPTDDAGMSAPNFDLQEFSADFAALAESSGSDDAGDIDAAYLNGVLADADANSTTDDASQSRTVVETHAALALSTVTSDSQETCAKLGGTHRQAVILRGKEDAPPSVVKLTAVEEVRRKADEVREEYKREHNQKQRRKRKLNAECDEGDLKEKYQRRLDLNRQSAAAARVRRDIYVKLLEDYLSAFEADKLALTRERDEFKRENAQLKAMNEKPKIKMVAGAGVDILQRYYPKPEINPYCLCTAAAA